MAKKTTITNLIFQQNILTILLLTLVVVGAWIGFTIYFSYSKSTVTTTDAALIAPLTPKLDSALFDKIATRKSWTESELNSFQPSVVLTITEASAAPAPTATPIATPVASVSATPTSSPSATQP
jgi:hypothetical protein